MLVETSDLLSVSFTVARKSMMSTKGLLSVAGYREQDTCRYWSHSVNIVVLYTRSKLNLTVRISSDIMTKNYDQIWVLCSMTACVLPTAAPGLLRDRLCSDSYAHGTETVPVWQLTAHTGPGQSVVENHLLKTYWHCEFWFQLKLISTEDGDSNISAWWLSSKLASFSKMLTFFNFFFQIWWKILIRLNNSLWRKICCSCHFYWSGFF